MKLNLAMTALQVERAREPEIGTESHVYFADENCILLGTLLCTAAAVGAFSSAGGVGIPTGGRDLALRCMSPEVTGNGSSAMTATFNAILDDDAADTVVATFHVPTYTPSTKNIFPMGMATDFTPTTPANAGKKVKTLGTLVSVANMSPGNQFEIITIPNDADFTYIDCTTSKAGQFNYPAIVEIPCGTNPAAYTKLGRGDSNPLSVGFRDRGPLEQLNRFAMRKGTCRIDVVKGGNITSARILYGGWIPRPATSRGDGNDVAEATAEGPYERFLTGYPRVTA